MGDAARLNFLPWVRAGAARAIAGADRLSGALDANATLTPWVRIAGHDAIGQTVMLRGAGHVTALGEQAIVRMVPADGTQDFEPNYFPFVELRAADLPWRYTPAAPGKNNQLRPWLVLVVVRQQDGVSIVSESEAKLPVLRIEAPAKPSLELPDLSDSAAWAHVQTALPPDTLADALERDETAAVARLICPRRLEPNASWIACLVPAFDVGRQAGLGEEGASAGEAQPAWDHAAKKPSMDEGVVRLPVYHRWMFSTGPDGDFELLARRLEPDAGKTPLGRVGLDVTDPGPPLRERRAGRPVIADYVGALRSRGVERREIPREHREWLDTRLESLLERGAQRLRVDTNAPPDYLPERDDPVVAPPLYGSFQADRYDVPKGTDDIRAWMRGLNLHPELRAIAGLGAAVVRKSQESLMASAWAQGSAIRDAHRVFDQGRLAGEIGRSMARRVRRWKAGALLQATHRIHAWIDSPASQNRLAVDLQRSAVPPGLVGAPFTRVTRPRSALGRAWPPARARGMQRNALSSPTETFLAATGASANARMRAALDFAKTTLPPGAWSRDPALEAVATAAVASVVQKPSALRVMPRAVAVREIAYPPIAGPLSGEPFDGTYAGAVGLENELLRALGSADVVPAPTRPLLDLSAAATSVMAQIDPLRSIQPALVARVPALSGLLAADGALPSRVVLHPIFTDPLAHDLTRLDARWLLPGADELENNKVALLEADDDFVTAFLAGANHEMSRELVWREFPTSPRHTFFHRFWDTGEDGPDDIKEISAWEMPRLGANLTGVASDALTVILLRGDLVRRYPEAHIYLTGGTWKDNEAVPDATTISEPLLQGALDHRTIFLGFPVSSDDMRGRRRGTARTAASAGWFVTIEEPAHGPRLGLDPAADDGSDLTSGASAWTDLSWGHLVPPGGALADVRFADARTPLPSRTRAKLGGAAWGHNAAHMAAITWRVPFRLFIHADRLLTSA